MPLAAAGWILYSLYHIMSIILCYIIILDEGASCRRHIMSIILYYFIILDEGASCRRRPLLVTAAGRICFKTAQTTHNMI
jgi:hypothetical protein